MTRKNTGKHVPWAGLVLIVTGPTCGGAPQKATAPGPTPARTAAAAAGPLALIPAPISLTTEGAPFSLADGTPLVVPAGEASIRAVAELLAERLAGAGRRVRVVEAPPADKAPSVVFTLDEGKQAEASFGPEGYALSVAKAQIALRAHTAAGLHFGAQTLWQLLPISVERGAGTAKATAWNVPAVTLVDKPRFSWRGMHLDVSRHFFGKDFVKRYIDVLAALKLNVFHFHLGDDHGWRLEIKKFPRLTSVGAWRADRRNEPWTLHEDWRRKMGPDDKPYGGFYTQDDIREIVEYARRRHVTVLPEIEIPGHSQAVLAAYPELSCAKRNYKVAAGALYEFSDPLCPCKPEVYRFLEGVLDEVFELFPSQHIHVGADEVRKVSWGESPACRALMKKEGITELEGLQSTMLRRISEYVRARGRTVIGWEEMMEGGAPEGAVIMAWKGDAAVEPAVRAGHAVISVPSSHYYFGPSSATDWSFLRKIYEYEPVSSALQALMAEPGMGRVLGAQGALWTEPVQTEEAAWRSVLPALLALSETLWSPRERRGWDDFKARLDALLPRLDAAGLPYKVPEPAGPPPDTWFLDGNVSATLHPADANLTVRYTLDGSDPDGRSPIYDAPLSIDGTGELRARAFTGSGGESNVATFRFHKLGWRDPVPKTALKPGLSFSYREGPVRSAHDVSKLKERRRGVLPQITLPPGHRADKFGMEVTGYLVVPDDGLYRLCVESNDGALLFIGGELVLDNDDLHGMQEKCTGLALRAGPHPILLKYFQYTQNKGLFVRYFRAPGAGAPEPEKRELPAEMLWH